MAVRLNSKGIQEVAKSDAMQRVIRALAEDVADNINRAGYTASSGASDSGAELHAEVEMQETDRARAVVKVNHPAALAFQAKHGMFTRAASEAGVEVRGK